MSFKAMAWAVRRAVPKHRKALKGLPLAVYYALCDTANNSTLVAHPSVLRLAEQCDCDPRKVSDATKLLQSLGLIYITHKNNSNNRYLINVPDHFSEDQQFHPATESRADGFDQATGEPIPAHIEKPNNQDDGAKRILDFLNMKTGRNFPATPSTLDRINARLDEGFTEDQLRAVTAKKCREWKKDPKMNQFLRPKTLFDADNFSNYRGELGR